MATATSPTRGVWLGVCGWGSWLAKLGEGGGGGDDGWVVRWEWEVGGMERQAGREVQMIRAEIQYAAADAAVPAVAATPAGPDAAVVLVARGGSDGAAASPAAAPAPAAAAALHSVVACAAFVSCAYGALHLRSVAAPAAVAAALHSVAAVAVAVVAAVAAAVAAALHSVADVAVAVAVAAALYSVAAAAVAVAAAAAAAALQLHPSAPLPSHLSGNSHQHSAAALYEFVADAPSFR